MVCVHSTEQIFSSHLSHSSEMPVLPTVTVTVCCTASVMLMTMQDIDVGDVVVSTSDGEMGRFVGDGVRHSAVGDAASANGCEYIYIYSSCAYTVDTIGEHLYIIDIGRLKCLL